MDISKGNNWVFFGLVWGVFMLVFTQFVFPSLIGEEIVYDNLYFNIPWWLLVGIVSPYFVKRKQSKKE